MSFMPGHWLRQLFYRIVLAIKAWYSCSRTADNGHPSSRLIFFVGVLYGFPFVNMLLLAMQVALRAQHCATVVYLD